MALAFLSSAVSIASLLAIGITYYRYQEHDPEVRASDTTNVNIIYIIKEKKAFLIFFILNLILVISKL